MLVAPLMTPLLGVGLALTQGNPVLFRETILTVARGFLVAFLIGVLMGFWLGGLPTPEMDARGAPSLIDLLVAMLSGIAAAYATSRPNLSSALPGVAIAASLVPPIATAGLAMHVGDLDLAVGSLMLFFTNIVAIAVGTAISFWCIGIRGKHLHGDEDPWTVVAASVLAAIMILVGYVDAHRHAIPAALAPSLREIVTHDVGGADQTPENQVVIDVRWHRLGARHGIQVQLATPRPISDATLEKIRDEVKKQMTRQRLEAIWIQNTHHAAFEIE